MIIDIEKITEVDQEKDLEELFNTEITEDIFPELIIDTIEIEETEGSE